MKFGEALEELRVGKRIARQAWAEGDYLMKITYCEIRCRGHNGYETAASSPNGVDLWIAKRVGNVLQPWHPWHDDLLAEDWMVSSA